MDTKICTKCQQLKSVIAFNKCTRNKDGLQYACIPCANKATQLSRLKRLPEDIQKIKHEWYLRNRELSIERAKQYHLDNPEWSKEMSRKHSSTWRQRYPDKAKVLQKKQTFKRKLRKYDLSPEDFQAMHDNQKGKCAICQVVPPDGLVIDHNHNTNKVRELLCNRCNPAVGMIGENPDIARKIIEYLTKHESAGIDSPSESGTKI